MRKEHIIPLLRSFRINISRAVILKHGQNHEESLLKHGSLSFRHRVSDSVVVGASLRICLENELLMLFAEELQRISESE